MLKRILSFVGWSIASFFFVVALLGLTQPTRILSFLFIIWGLIWLPSLYHRWTRRYSWKRNVFGRLAVFFIAPILIAPAISASPQVQTSSPVSAIGGVAGDPTTPVAVQLSKPSPSSTPLKPFLPAASEAEPLSTSNSPPIATSSPMPAPKTISPNPVSSLSTAKSITSDEYKRKPPAGIVTGMHSLERHTESRDYLEFGEFAVNFPQSPIVRSKDGEIYPGQSEEVNFSIANKYGDKVRVSTVCHWNGDDDYAVSSISYQTIDGSELPTTEPTIIKHAHQVCAN